MENADTSLHLCSPDAIGMPVSASDFNPALASGQTSQMLIALHIHMANNNSHVFLVNTSENVSEDDRTSRSTKKKILSLPSVAAVIVHFPSQEHKTLVVSMVPSV